MVKEWKEYTKHKLELCVEANSGKNEQWVGGCNIIIILTNLMKFSILFILSLVEYKQVHLFSNIPKFLN